MRDIHEELVYDQPPQLVFDLISTGAFQLEVMAHLGGRHPEVVDEERRPDGSVRLVTRQHTELELPGFARKLIPASTTVTHVFDWEPPQPDGLRKGTWSAEAKGAPVTIGGLAELRPNGEGTCHFYLGQVRASVPVVGSKLEAFAVDNLRRELGRTHAFVVSRLSKR